MLSEAALVYSDCIIGCEGAASTPQDGSGHAILTPAYSALAKRSMLRSGDPSSDRV